MAELRECVQVKVNGLCESETSDKDEGKMYIVGNLTQFDKETSEVDVTFSTGGRGVNGSQFRKQSANLRALYEKAKKLGILQTTKERGHLPKREDENRNRWHARSSKVSKKIYEPLLENGFLHLEKTIRKKSKDLETAQMYNEKLLCENKVLKEKLATSENALSLLSDEKTNDHRNETKEQTFRNIDQECTLNQNVADYVGENLGYASFTERDQELANETFISGGLDNEYHISKFTLHDDHEIDPFAICDHNDMGGSALDDLHPESSSNFLLRNSHDIFDGSNQLLFN